MTLLDPTVLDGKILNLYKVLELPYDGQNTIKDLYRSLLWESNSWDPAKINTPSNQWNPIPFTNIYNTLNDYGYLTTRRDKNLDQLL
jgi:hypothetical protein